MIGARVFARVIGLPLAAPCVPTRRLAVVPGADRMQLVERWLVDMVERFLVADVG